MSNIADEIIKTIKYAIDKKTINCDRTFKSVIKQTTNKGYVILDESGTERVVKCCIPNVSLKAGQMVWVKIPCGKIKDMHVIGVV